MKKAIQSEQTKENIIKTAAKCFAEKGFSACSMNDIAVTAGVSKGALYGHFASKEALFKNMILSEHARGADRARLALASPPYIDAIVNYMKACIRDWGFPIDHRLWVEVLAVAARDPNMKAVFTESERTTRNIFKTLIQKGIEAGEIDESIDVEGISILLFALGDGIIARIADDPSYDFQQHFGVFETVVKNALQKRAG